MTFAESIRQTRQRLFFSQEAFAKELNVNLTTVSRWETGKSKPNMSTMRQIKEFCSKSILILRITRVARLNTTMIIWNIAFGFP